MEQIITYILLIGVIFRATNVHATKTDIEFWNNVRHSYRFRIVDYESSATDSDPPRTSVFLDDIFGTTNMLAKFEPADELIAYLRTIKITENSEPITLPLSITKFEHPKIPYFHEFEHIQTASIKTRTSRYVKIIGGPRSGKTSALRSMYHQHLTIRGKLALFIDIPHVFTDSATVSKFKTTSDVFRLVAPAHVVTLIEEVSRIAPHRIKIFLDNIDRAPEHAEKIVWFLGQLYHVKQNAIVTSAGSTKMENRYPSKLVSKEIPIPTPMHPSELKEYTTNYWIKKWTASGHQIPEASLVESYWNAFRIMTQDIPLPRTVAMAQQLADYVLGDNGEVTNPFRQVAEYTGNLWLLRNHLFQAIKQSDHHNFPKMRFYDEYMREVSNPSQFEVYGVLALFMLRHQYKLPRPKSAKVDNDRAMTQLDALGGPKTFPYLEFNAENKPIRFLSSDLMFYFAAKYIMRSFPVNQRLLRQFVTLMRESKCTEITELINSAIMTDSTSFVLLHEHVGLAWQNGLLFKLTSGTYKEDITAVLDYLIENRFDGLASIFFSVTGREIIVEYLRDETRILHSKNRYSFGMIAHQLNTGMYPDYFSRKSQVFSGTRPQMIAKLMMQRTVEAAKYAGFEWDATYFLETCATQSIEALKQLLDDYRHIREPYPVEMLNRAMYESVKALGPKSVEIVQELQLLGGVPSEVDVDGSTLAHVAVKWSSLELVKILHESFGVSFNDKPDNTGKTILFTALDANSFMTVTPDGFWPMMEYLIENGKFECNIEMIRNNPPTSASMEGIFPSYLTLLTEETALREIASAVNVFELVMMDDIEMTAEQRSIRRNKVIMSCVLEISMGGEINTVEYLTLTEVLAKYRGAGILSSDDETAFDRTIIASLTLEAATIPEQHGPRVFMNILKNIRSFGELQTVWKMYNEYVKPLLSANMDDYSRDAFIQCARDLISFVDLPNNAQVFWSEGNPPLVGYLRNMPNIFIDAHGRAVYFQSNSPCDL